MYMDVSPAVIPARTDRSGRASDATASAAPKSASPAAPSRAQTVTGVSSRPRAAATAAAVSSSTITCRAFATDMQWHSAEPCRL
jgi:hypothetical protein